MNEGLYLNDKPENKELAEAIHTALFCDPEDREEAIIDISVAYAKRFDLKALPGCPL